MEHASLKVVPEPRFPTSVPSTIYNLPRILLSYSYSKRHVLVRRPRVESNHTPIAVGGIGLQRERGPLLFINQIGIENIKRISLNHLRRRVLPSLRRSWLPERGACPRAEGADRRSSDCRSRPNPFRAILRRLRGR